MSDPVVVTETSTALPPFVNQRVSWQASLTNALLRRFVKTRLGNVFDIASMRVSIAKLDRLIGRGTKALLCEERNAAGISCRWLQQPANSDRVLLYIHGGLFCFHLPRTYTGFAARICQEIGANALIPDYRLAPRSTLSRRQSRIASLHIDGYWSRVIAPTILFSQVILPVVV